LDDAGRKAALERFLARHHAPDQAARKAVVDYLASLKRP
jgi:hypothetical protein